MWGAPGPGFLKASRLPRPNFTTTSKRRNVTGGHDGSEALHWHPAELLHGNELSSRGDLSRAFNSTLTMAVAALMEEHRQLVSLSRSCFQAYAICVCAVVAQLAINDAMRLIASSDSGTWPAADCQTCQRLCETCSWTCTPDAVAAAARSTASL